MDEYKRASFHKLNYSNTIICPNELSIPSASILFEEDVKKVKPIVLFDRELPYFFEKPDADFPFDIFGAVFYLVTRYEEYNSSSLDKYGRYQSAESIAVQNQFIQLPLVDLWIQQLKRKIQKKFPDLKAKERRYQYLPSMDVDMAWSFRNKGFTRNLGGFLKDLLKLNLPQASKRTRVLVGNKKDPFDQFDFMYQLHINQNQSLLHFFLVANRGVYDKNISIENQDFKNLIRKIFKQNPVGLHPSYQSNKDMMVLQKEKDNLEYITGSKIKKSRQHFLKLQMPHSYRQLVELGIEEDYTMGYPDVLGFRASTSIPFKWFDLDKNEETTLTIFPFQIMDVTMKNYLKLTPQQSIDQSKQIIDQCKKVNGTFMTIWHNSSFDENEGWKDWDKVYTQIVDYAS